MISMTPVTAVLGRATVTNATGGKTLATLGVTLDPNCALVSITNLPGSGTVYLNFGTANATTSYKLSAGNAITIEALYVQLLTLKIFVASGETADLNIQQESAK